MGTSKKLHDKLTGMAAPLKLPTGPQRGRSDMPSVEKFIRDGLDPIHAGYAFVQHITSIFSQGVSGLPETSTFAAIAGRAEAEYMPSGPPMSPLTRGMSQSEVGTDKLRLHKFLKYGQDLNYWNEFVFKGYYHHHADAIYLAGIPDLKATLPHA